MRRLRLFLASFAAVSAGVGVACNALTGVSDLSTVGSCDNCDASDATTDHASRSDAPTEIADAAKDASTDAPFDRPSFCDGIVLYAPFDGTLVSKKGGPPSKLPSPNDVPFASGKFGMGVQLAGAAALLYYHEGTGGYAYPRAAGTFAVWFKPSWSFPQTVDRIIVKPIDDSTTNLNESGPQLRYENSITQVGMMNQNPDASFTSAGIGEGFQKSGWVDRDFNHLVGTWNASTSLLTFSLNGGATASLHRESTAPWMVQALDITNTRLSSDTSPADGIFDEFAVWNRELSLKEVGALYQSKLPIDQACGF